MINDTTHRDVPSLEGWNPSQKCWETRTVSCNLQFTPQLPNFFVNIHRGVEQKTIPLKPHLLVGLPAASFNQNCCLSKLCAFTVGVCPFCILLRSTHIFAIKIGNLTGRFQTCLFVACSYSLLGFLSSLQIFQKVQPKNYHLSESFLFKCVWICLVNPLHPSFTHSTFTAFSQQTTLRPGVLWQNQKHLVDSFTAKIRITWLENIDTICIHFKIQFPALLLFLLELLNNSNKIHHFWRHFRCHLATKSRENNRFSL